MSAWDRAMVSNAATTMFERAKSMLSITGECFVRSALRGNQMTLCWFDESAYAMLLEARMLMKEVPAC